MNTLVPKTACFQTSSDTRAELAKSILAWLLHDKRVRGPLGDCFRYFLHLFILDEDLVHDRGGDEHDEKINREKLRVLREDCAEEFRRDDALVKHLSDRSVEDVNRKRDRSEVHQRFPRQRSGNHRSFASLSHRLAVYVDGERRKENGEDSSRQSVVDGDQSERSRREKPNHGDQRRRRTGQNRVRLRSRLVLGAIDHDASRRHGAHQHVYERVERREAHRVKVQPVRVRLGRHDALHESPRVQIVRVRQFRQERDDHQHLERRVDVLSLERGDGGQRER